MPSITRMQAALGRGEFVLVVLVVLATALLAVHLLRRRGSHRAATVAAAIGLGVAVAGVLSLTLPGLHPPAAAARRLYLDPVAGARGWETIAWWPVIDNVVLFVPVGALAAATWWRRALPMVWLSCTALSLGIEVLQYVIPTGRVANTADLLANSVGALLGAVLAVLLGARWRGSRGRRETGMLVRA